MNTASCRCIKRGGNLHIFLKLTLPCVCLVLNSGLPAVGRGCLCRSSVELLVRCSWTGQVRVFSDIRMTLVCSCVPIHGWNLMAGQRCAVKLSSEYSGN